MMTQRRRSICYVFYLFAIVGGRSWASETDGGKLLAQTIANRLQIKTWQVRLTHTRSGIGAPENEIVEQRYYVDGDRHRIDTVRRDRVELKGLVSPLYTDYLIRTASERISYSTRRYVSGVKSALSIAPVHLEQDIPVADVRGIGLHAQGWHFGSHPSEIYEGSGIVISGTEFEDVDGISTIKVSLAHESGGRMAIWIDPARGPSPIRVEAIGAEGSDKGREMRARTDVQIRRWAPSQIWFPERLVYEEFVGSELVLHEETDVEVVAFNEPFDESVFTIAGIGAPPGTAVYKIPDSESANLLWDGERIVTADARPIKIEESAPRIRSRRQWLLLLNAFGLSVICVSCFWRFRAKRRAGE